MRRGRHRARDARDRSVARRVARASARARRDAIDATRSTARGPCVRLVRVCDWSVCATGPRARPPRDAVRRI